MTTSHAPTTASSQTATLTVLFFGRPSDVFGSSLEIEIPAAGLTLEALRARLIAHGGVGAEQALDSSVRAFVDQTVVEARTRVRPHQEVAFFSALSGG